jgi:O-antigen ligase/Flp pilus assembly protein TadD
MIGEIRGSLERIQVIAIAVVVFILPLLMWPGLTDYNYTKSIASLILISLLLILWGVTAWRRPTWTIRVPWVLIPVAGLAVASVLSAIQATNSLVVFQSSLLLVYYILLLWMIANVVRDQRDVRWILMALVASGTLAALYGVLQFFSILPGTPGNTGVTAILSTMGNRNHLGGFLLYLFYPGIILLLQAKSPWLKGLTLGVLLFVLASMLLVNQVSVQIAFLLLAAALVIGLLIFRTPQPLRANRWWLTALAGVAFGMFLVGLCFELSTQPPTPVDSNSWLASTWQSNSGDKRSADWWIGLGMLAEHPATGVGLGNYKLNFIPYKADFLASERGQAFPVYIERASQAHNEYIQAGAELGAVGLIMLFASLLTLAITLWIRLQRNVENSRIAILLLTMGILAFLVHSLVSFPAHVVGSSLELITFCGLALSVCYGTSATFTWKLHRWKAKSVHCAIIVMGLAVSAFAVADARANWLMEQGIRQVEAGQFSTAEHSLQRSLRLDFAPRQTFYYLAISQIQLGKLDEAQASLAECMTGFIDEASLLNYANLLVNTGQSELAFEPLDLLLESHPRLEIQRRAYYLRALAISETGDPELAISLIQELLLGRYATETAYIGLGSIYESLGRIEEALATYTAGIEQTEAALAGTRAIIEKEAGQSTPKRVRDLQARMAKLTYERATLLERLRTLPNVSSP